MNLLDQARAIQELLIRADPPIQAYVDFYEHTVTKSKPGAPVNWKQVESTFNMFEKETPQGKLRAVVVAVLNCSKEKEINGDTGHVMYVGIEEGGRYSTLNSMSGLLEDW